jgi:nucleotide-binding universal stress UspA family protein
MTPKNDRGGTPAQGKTMHRLMVTIDKPYDTSLVLGQMQFIKSVEDKRPVSRRRNDMTIEIKRILLPTDFSAHSAAATRYACELATRFDAELHLLHALEVHPASTPTFGIGLALPQYVHESKAAAEKALTSILDPQWAAGRKVVHALIEKSPKVEIVRYARTHEIDLIVLATHGRSGLAHVLIGSVAESVVRTAPCPVLTVRPEGHQFVMP